MAQKFPLGSFNAPFGFEKGAKEAERWARCGMTVTQSFRFNYDTDDKAQMTALLDECEKYGIKLFIYVQDLDFHAFTNCDEYRERFLRAYHDFGKHPAACGFFLGDEPWGREEYDHCAEACRIHREIAPELTPFLNYRPWFYTCEETMLGGRTLTEWAKEHTAVSGHYLFCYDCYSQMIANDGYRDGLMGLTWEEGTHMYFRSLRKYMESVNAVGGELWTILLSAAHWQYRKSTEDDFRWQLNTAVASGCRGIMWFLFYGWMSLENYRDAPVDEFDEETEVYRDLARVQKRFQIMHGELLMGLKHKSTYHIVTSYGETELFPEGTHPFVERVDSPDGIPGIISFFEDENGKEYCAIVSNTPFRSGRLNLVLTPNVKTIYQAVKGEMHTVRALTFTGGNDVVEGNVKEAWLAPGQMEIFRFE